MPRHARLDVPATLNHIIIRGIDKKHIFIDDADRKDFIDRCSIIFPETHTACYAWVLMTNHVHMLLHSGNIRLSTVLARLLTGYATHFNRRHNRSGHLFQNRYRSIICQEEVYLKELVRYIHLNPIRAGIAKNLDSFAWSGHQALIGKKKCEWQDVDFVLSFFGKDIQEARLLYEQFINAGIDQGRKPELTGGGLIRSHGGWQEVSRLKKEITLKGDERILKDTSFVMSIIKEAEDRFKHEYALKQAGISLETIEKKVSDIYAVDLFEKGRYKKLVEARSLFCYWAARELKVSLKSLADLFELTETAIGYAVRRGKEIADKGGLKLIDNR